MMPMLRPGPPCLPLPRLSFNQTGILGLPMPILPFLRSHHVINRQDWTWPWTKSWEDGTKSWDDAKAVASVPSIAWIVPTVELLLKYHPITGSPTP